MQVIGNVKPKQACTNQSICILLNEPHRKRLISLSLTFMTDNNDDGDDWSNEF